MNSVKRFFRKFSAASNCIVKLINVDDRENEIVLFRADIAAQHYGCYENYKVNVITIKDNVLFLYIEER